MLEPKSFNIGGILDFETGGEEQEESRLWHEMQTLAYAAYEGYTRYGRGVLEITGKELGPETIRYLPLGYYISTDAVEQLVKKYDPEREFICVFNLGGAMPVVMCVTPDEDITPLSIYETEDRQLKQLREER
jgi:hypothetical protein